MVGRKRDKWYGRELPRVSSRRFRAVAGLAFAVNAPAAAVALGRFLYGLRVRGWNDLCAIGERHPQWYRRWITVREPELLAAAGATRRSALAPVVVAILGPDDAASKESAASACAAFDEQVSVVRFDAAEDLRSLGHGDAQWVLALPSGDRLARATGAILADRLAREDDFALLFWDEDTIQDGERTLPFPKPEWDTLLAESIELLAGSCVVRCDALVEALDVGGGEAAGESEKLSRALRCVAQVHRSAHLPLILTHRLCVPAIVSRDRDDTTWDLAEPGWPSVSVIIPTRDRADLVATVLAGLDRLTYPGPVEVIVADNDSTQPDLSALLDEREAKGQLRVVRYPGPFNFAAICNAAVAKATGEYICLLNNDIEPIDGAWLQEMMQCARSPGAGAVGAMLLYPDGRIQHAGIAVGIGGAAGHLARFASHNDTAFVAWYGASRRVSAVTAACLVVCKADYDEIGGLDAQAFRVAFNDVDFCLRLQQSGRRNLYVAEARLVHHESLTRGSDRDPSNRGRFAGELARLRARWGTESYSDPCSSLLFSRMSEQCRLAF